MSISDVKKRSFYQGNSEIILIEEEGNKKLIKSVDGTEENKKSDLFQEFTIQENKNLNFTRKILKKGYYNGKPSIWMEYIEGVSLYELSQKKQISLTLFIDIAIKLVTAINELHQNNIIHKDISSKNILIDLNNEIKLIDLEHAVRHEYKIRNFSNLNKLEGTLEYISPELTGRINQVVDVRSDLYSIGVVLYKLLTGVYPFSHKDAGEFIYSHIAIKPKSPIKINNEIPEVVSKVVMKLLEKKSDNRYQTAIGLLKDLKTIKSALEDDNSFNTIVLGKQDFNYNLRIPKKLFGREKEIETLQSFLYSSFKVMFISGKSGTGKTSLVNNLHPYIGERKGYFSNGKFDQLNRNKPYSALADIFKGFLESIYTEPAVSISQWKKDLSNKLGNSAYILEPIVPGITSFLNAKKELAPTSYVDEQNLINFVFGNFINCLAEKDKLLVAFIDDFQWADLSSLQVLEYALKNLGDNSSLYIIGSYRPEEVNEDHIFYNFRKRLEENEVPTDKINLTNLFQEDIQNILWETFRNNKEDNTELASIIYSKTNGNAFFINQFIKTIYNKNLVTLDLSNGKWTFDINAIQKASFSSNVLDLLLNQIEGLDNDVQLLLSHAACSSRKFNLTELKNTLKFSNSDLSNIVEECVSKNFIEPINSNFLALIASNEKEIFFAFTHDKIQEISYSLLPDNKKIEIHLKFAQNNLIQQNKDSKTNYLTANHFNKVIELGYNTNQELATEVFNANLKAGIEAKKSAAFEIAENYFNTAQALLSNSITVDDNTLYQLKLNYAEVLHLTGRNTEAEEKYLSLASTTSEKYKNAEIAEKLIHFYTNNGRFKEAYQVAVTALKKFNFNIPKSPLKPRLIIKVIKTKVKLKKTPIEELINLPQATDSETITIISLIGSVLKSAYQIAPELCVEASTELVNLCLKKGNTKDSPVGYFVFGGIFLGGVLGNHELGYKFGDLSLKMADKYNSTHQRSEVQFIYSYFANTWQNGIESSNQLFDNAYDSGAEIGDFFHMSCSRTARIQSNFMFGTPLNTILEENAPYLSFVTQSNNKEAEFAFKSVIQSIKALQGKTEAPGSFNDEGFNEADFIKEESSLKARHFLHYYYVNKMIVHYHLKQYKEAHIMMKRSEKYLGDSLSMQHVVWHHLYKGLISASLLYITKNKKHLSDLKKADKYLRKAKAFNSKVYGNISDLVSLEVNKEKLTHDQLYAKYEAFINRLKEDQTIQLLAIAYENYARALNVNNQSEKSQEQIANAKGIYQSWGANALYNNTPKQHSSSKKQTVVSVQIKDLDINSIFKASAAISEETNQSKLFIKMMNIMIENMGATRAILVLNNNNEHTIQAEFHNGKTEVMNNIKLSDTVKDNNYPSSIINYVVRTKDDVILNGGFQKSKFSSDNYLVKNKVQSVLCHPLINQQQLMGVIYLENNLSENLFNDSRVEMLHLLSTQMTISLKNVLLYENLEAEVKERTNQITLQSEIIETKTKEIFDSINYAKKIQFATMPEHKELSKLFKDSFILYKPKDIVSGDFYYFTELPSKEKIIFAVDCTGHGVPGALMSVIGSVAINNIINSQKVYKPNKILSLLQFNISQAFKHSKIPINDGMDLTISLIDNEGTLHCSGAMNGAVVITPSGELTYLSPDRVPIGGERANNHQFNTTSITPEKGSMLYMMTDGYQDQFGGEKGKKFRKKQLYQVFEDIHKLPAEEQLLTLNTKFDTWKGNEEQLDDVLLIGVRI